MAMAGFEEALWPASTAQVPAPRLSTSVYSLASIWLVGWLPSRSDSGTGERGRVIPVAVCLHHLTQTLLIRPRVVAAARHCAAGTLYVQDEDQGNPGVDPPLINSPHV